MIVWMPLETDAEHLNYLNSTLHRKILSSIEDYGLKQDGFSNKLNVPHGEITFLL